MTEDDVGKSAQLKRRVRELEAENARLATEPDAADSDTAARPARGRGGWWRALLSALCILRLIHGPGVVNELR